MIREELGDLSLMIRPTFIMADEEYELIDVESKKLGPEQLIENQLDGYGNSDVKSLAIDLYHLLSKDMTSEAQVLLYQYYNDHYSEIDEEIEFKTEEIKKFEPLEEENKQQTLDKEAEQ